MVSSILRQFERQRLPHLSVFHVIAIGTLVRKQRADTGTQAPEERDVGARFHLSRQPWLWKASERTAYEK